MENLTGYFILDALMNQYFLALGEFHLENFSDHPHAFLVYFFFVMATLFTQVTILNMVIAIMGDTFGKVMDNKVVYATETKMRLLGDYTGKFGTTNSKAIHAKEKLFMYVVSLD